MRALSIAVTALLASILTLIFVVKHDTPDRHEHILIEDDHPNFKLRTKITICLTDSMQVTWNGHHHKTRASEDYFENY